MIVRHRIGVDFARLVNLADGIFAVAMTFLAFSIQLPTPDHARPDGGLLDKIDVLLPQLGALGLTYFIAARYWILHCDLHRMVTHGDKPLVWLNLAFLLGIVLLPFTTEALGAFPLSGLSVGLYAANLAALASLFAAIWAYAVRHPACLARPDLVPEARVALRVVMSFATLFLLAIAVAQVFPYLAMALLIAPPLLNSVIGRVAGRFGMT